jgi:hypothetical protein
MLLEDYKSGGRKKEKIKFSERQEKKPSDHQTFLRYGGVRKLCLLHMSFSNTFSSKCLWFCISITMLPKKHTSLLISDI